MKFNTSIRVEAPQDIVWEYFANLEKAEERIEAIKRLEILTDGPVGEGTRWRETRVMFKKEATEEMWITSWDPPAGYTVSAASCGMEYSSAFRLRPDGSATVVEFEMDAIPKTLGAKLFSPLAKLMFGPMMRRCIQKDFGDLKRLAESGGPGAAERALA